MRLRSFDADMTSGNIWRQLLRFALPMVFGLIFQQFYNTVDTIVVGRFVGKEALAAVGSTGSIINMLISLSSGLSVGAGVVISQHYGAHDDTALSDTVQTTIVITFILSLLSAVIGVLICRPMLRLMSTPEEVMDDASLYLTIYFAGLPGQIVYNMGSGILRSVGDSRRPLYFLIFSACLNILLDLFFVIILRCKVDGVAYATILSQAVSAILVLIVLTRANTAYAIHWRRLRITGSELRKILKIGFPTAVQQGITSFSNVFVQGYINVFGASCMAGWSAYNKLDAFVLVPMQAISMASTTFVGQNYGAKQMERARRGVSTAIVMSEIVTFVLGAVAVSAASLLMHIFTEDAEVIRYGALFIRIITPFYLCNCINQMYAGALRGIGRSLVPTLVMLFSFVLFRQIFLFCNKTFFGNNFWGMALAYPSGWITCTLLMTVFYRRSELIRGLPQEQLKQ